MHILCDTCSVLMVIRVVPDMFIDERYQCVTTVEVRQEIVRTQKFKDKYPWRDQYIGKIPTLAGSFANSDSFKLYFDSIHSLIGTGIINQRTSRWFSLSRVDQRIIACALANSFYITTTDNDLIDFLSQEFSSPNSKTVVSPLELINGWLRVGLLKWNDHHQSILRDWSVCNEAPQLRSDIQDFQSLTGYPYLGP